MRCIIKGEAVRCAIRLRALNYGLTCGGRRELALRRMSPEQDGCSSKPWRQRQKKEPRACPRGSITFIEIVIVTATIAVISLATYSIFSSGLKIWQRVNQVLPEEDIDIFFDKFSFDVKNSLFFKGLKFEGNHDGFQIVTAVYSPRLKAKTVGKIIYTYDSYARTLVRQERDFSHLYTGQEGVPFQSLGDVTFLQFHYYFYDDQKDEFRWEDEWSNPKPPLAVRVEFRIGDDERERAFIKTVSIPISG